MKLSGDRSTALALAAFALVAALPYWLSGRRPAAPELRAAHVFVVSSAADAGPGSLRETILEADRAPGRARIVFTTPRVVVEQPLPALVNPAGVVIDGGDGGCDVDAGGGDGGVLDVAAPDSAVRGLRIRGGGDHAVLVRADRVRLLEVEIEGFGDGVRVADGVRDLAIEDSRFRANGVGVRLAAAGLGTALRRNRFERHDDAAVWAVAPRPLPADLAGGLEIEGNRFVEDRISIVLGNVPATVTGNELDGAFEAAIYLTGRGAVVRGNRIRGAVRVGIYGEGPVDALVAGNELDGNQVAMLLQDARGTVVRSNRLHANGDGLATVFEVAGGGNVIADNLLLGQRRDALLVVGASPELRGNRALYNQRAGLRLVDVELSGRAPIAAAPRLEANVLGGNGDEGPVRDTYREPAGEEPE